MNKKKKIPLNAQFSALNSVACFVLGLYLVSQLIYSLFTGEVYTYPFFSKKLEPTIYSVDSEQFIKDYIFMGILCVISFFCSYLAKREMQNTLKFDLHGQPRIKKPYNEMWQLKWLGLFLLIVFMLFITAFW